MSGNNLNISTWNFQNMKMSRESNGNLVLNTVRDFIVKYNLPILNEFWLKTNSHKRFGDN